MKPTLLVLAAGMGSRYGGLKQLDPMGPNDETLLDYSIRDAIQAGFTKVVFVIRQEFADEFHQKVGDRYKDDVEIAYAYQSLDDLPPGFSPPEDRVKPWGTAHAVRAAREVIADPFVAINADDYYGADAYQRIAQYILDGHIDAAGDMATVGYPISNTLSSHGAVNRGVCVVNNGMLQSVEEHKEVVQQDDEIKGRNLANEPVSLSPDTLVSLNFWAFAPAFFEVLETYFVGFLKARITEPKAECYIPSVVDELIHSGHGQCVVLPTTGEWFGVTYPEDKPEVQRRLCALASARA